MGIPVFILAMTLSVFSHHYAHMMVKKYSCGSHQEQHVKIINITDRLSSENPDCAEASFAGITSTFILALTSFAFFIHHPRNLFLASMAFINATMRLPETITIFLQYLFHQKTTLIADESVALKLLHMHDQTAAVVILWFYSITIIFLSITIIHDTKVLPAKWVIAFVLFSAIMPLKFIAEKFVAPIVLGAL